MMRQAELPLEVLFRVLPRTAELAPVRQAILAQAGEDPERKWRGSAAYATVDRRVIGQAAVDAVFQAAESQALDHVRKYHRVLRRALQGLADADPKAALTELMTLGEEAFGTARWEECVSYFSVAVEAAAIIGDATAETLAARRLGLSHLHLGDVPATLRWYQRCADLAHARNDVESVINAHIGRGHALCVVGRWHDAELQYRSALELTEEASRLHAQVCTNLSMTAREQQRLDEARSWLDAAVQVWGDLVSSDRSVWYNNAGLLHLAREEYDDASAMFERALALSPSHFDTAMILDNLAELHIRSDRLHEAEAYARRAEDFAIAAASPRALADVYLRLGRISRVRGDANGVAFFEKALELTREGGYIYTEAAVCLEYARFRQRTGDPDEAEGLRERGLQLLRDAGADFMPR